MALLLLTENYLTDVHIQLHVVYDKNVLQFKFIKDHEKI